jgi:manganese/zinc/iron transport system permease protein
MSGALGAASCGVGILVSALVPRMAAGAVIVLSGTTAFTISLLFGTRRGIVWNWLRQRQSRRRIGQLDLLRACFEVVEGSTDVARDGSQVDSSIQRDLTGVPITRQQLQAARTWTALRLSNVLDAAQRDGLVRYDADGHYRLTAEGARRARRAARNHRLWELYLIHFAHIASSRVDREADEIEHVLEPEIIEQLEQLLEQDAAQVRIPVNPHR